jgi:titin
MTGLTNGVTYTFTVRAVSIIGQSLPSDPSNSVKPVTVPDAPTLVSGTPTDGAVDVSWSLPVFDGGTDIDSYTVTTSPTPNVAEDGTCTVNAPTRTCRISGLTNGVSYAFVVTAHNAVGDSNDSAPSVGVIPARVPDAPDAPVATRGNQSVSLAWQAPAFNGGSPITSYVVTASAGGFAVPGKTCTVARVAPAIAPLTSCIISGLTNGTAYTFILVAINGVGSSTDSLPSDPVTPATVPGAPTAVTVVSHNTSVSVSWTAPTDNGGEDVSSYTAAARVNGIAVVGKTCTVSAVAPETTVATTCDVTGLTNGTTYTFTVVATNGAGSSLASAPSSDVIPATVPTKPRNVASVSHDAEVWLSWDAPSNDGGVRVVSYLVTAAVDGVAVDPPATCSVSAPLTACIVSGLTNGTAYTFTVVAINSVGSSLDSVPTSAITPAGAPAAPTDISAITGDHQITVSWTAPTVTNGSDVVEYLIQYSTNDTQWSEPIHTGSAATTRVVTGLDNGISYTFRVAARNISFASVGPNGTATAPVIPAGTPDAPTGLDGVPYFGGAQLTWTAPTVNGGLPIIDYVVQYRLTTDVAWTTYLHTPSAEAALLVVGLSNGSDYYLRVAAKTAAAAGTSTFTSYVAVTPAAGAPSQPTGLVAVRGDQRANLSWVAPYDGGSPITDYVIEYSSDGVQWETFTHTPSDGTTVDVTGLANGRTYTFRVRAQNAVLSNGGLSRVSPESNPVTPCTTPGAPVGVSGVRGENRVTLNWSAPLSNGGAPITDYSVYVSTNGTDWSLYSRLASANSTDVAVTGLTNGTGYYFKVAAKNSAPVAEGPASEILGPLTPATRPGNVRNVVASSGARSVGLVWEAPLSDGGSAIIDYRVQYKAANGDWTTFDHTASADLFATVINLTNGTTYTFRVLAINTAEIPLSAQYVESNAVQPATVPGKPLDVVGVKGDRQATVTWSAPLSDGGLPILDYIVERSPNGSSSWTEITHPVSTARTLTVINLINDRTYYFRVRAVNGIGSILYSDASSAVTPNDLVVPLAPSGVRSNGAAADGALPIAWYAPSSDGGSTITTYVIQYRVVNVIGGAWSTFTHATSTSTSITVTGLTNGFDYEFRIAAVNGEGNSPFSTLSEPLTPTAPDLTPPAPNNVAATPGSTTALLTWNAPTMAGGLAPIDSYAIQSSMNGESWRDVTTRTGTTATSFVATDLTNNAVYRFRIRAHSSSGNGAWSAASAYYVPNRVANCSDRGPGAFLANCNLNSVNLGGLDLTGANLAGATLYSTNFNGAKLTGADLRYVRGSSTHMNSVDLSAANLTGASLTSMSNGGYLTMDAETLLTGADFSSSYLSYGNFVGVNFNGVNFSSANLDYSDVTDATFVGARLSSTYMSYSTAIRTAFNSAIMNSMSLGYTNVSGANFTNANLSSANLVHATFSSTTTAVGANFSRAQIGGTSLRNVDFTGANMSNINVDGSDLQGAILAGVTMVDAYVRYTNMRNVDMHSATVSNTRFNESNFTGANLRGLLGYGATFDGGIFIGANMDGADLSYTGFSNARMSSTTSAVGTTFNDAYFQNSQLLGVTFDGSSMLRAHLEGANLSGAVLTGVDMTSAYMSRAQFTGATFSSATILDYATINNTDLSGLNLAGVAFQSANLSSSNLAGADLHGANFLYASLNGANLTGANLSRVTMGGGGDSSNAIFTNADLSGITVSYQVYFTGAIFDGANLTNAYFDRSQMTYTSFVNATLLHSTFSSVNLNRANFTGAQVTGSNLTYCGLSYSIWTADSTLQNTTVYGSSFDSAVMRGVDLSNQQLTNSNFTAADLTGANFSGADLTGVTFTRASLRGVTINGDSILTSSTIGYVDFTGAILTGANFTNVSLGYSNLAAVDLRSTVLVSADLSYTNLTGANLSGVDAHNANFTNARAMGSNFSGANLRSATFDQVNFTGANLSGVDGSSANLSRTILRGADLTQADFTSATLTSAVFSSVTVVTNLVLVSASMAYTDLSGVDLSTVNLSSATLNFALLGGSTISASTILTNASLSYVNFATTTITGADFTNATLSGAYFTGKDLRSTTLTNANFTAANLATANFSGMTLTSTTFTGANLRAANFSGTTLLTGTTFSNAMLRNADFTSAVASNRDFGGSTLTGANFTSANLSSATLSSTRLSSTILGSANLTGASGSLITGTPASLPSGYSIVNGVLTH